jgi:hypothetical protein
MRTSNKILLGGFVATILIITSIHFVIHAKLKSGDLVTFKQKSFDNIERIVLGNIKHVSIIGLDEFHIVPGDTAVLDMNPAWKGNFLYRVVGDSLILEAGNISQAEYVNGARKFAPMTLHLPPVETITTNFAKVLLGGEADSTKAISRSIFISNSELNVLGGNSERTPTYWKSLQVYALHSQAIFLEGAVLKELSVNLNAGSSLTDGGADLQHFSVQVDSTSTVSLRKKSLNNIKLVK